MTQEEFKKYHEEILRGSAIHLITWIDYHAAPDKTCLSNEECKNIVDALVEGDWGKIYQYMKKKLEASDNTGESASTLTQKEVQKLYDHLEMHRELGDFKKPIEVNMDDLPDNPVDAFAKGVEKARSEMKSEPQTVTFIDSGTMQVIDKLNGIVDKLGDIHQVLSKPYVFPYRDYTPPSSVPGMDVWYKTHGVDKVPPVTCETTSGLNKSEDNESK